MRKFADLAEFVAAKGEHLGHSDWHEITQEQVDTLRRRDRRPPVDPRRRRARQGGPVRRHHRARLHDAVPDPPARQEIYQVRSLTMGINYGLNKVRFPAPVLVGARLRAGARTARHQAAPGRAPRLSLRITIEIEGDDKPACVAEIVVVLIPDRRFRVARRHLRHGQGPRAARRARPGHDRPRWTSCAPASTPAWPGCTSPWASAASARPRALQAVVDAELRGRRAGQRPPPDRHRPGHGRPDDPRSSAPTSRKRASCVHCGPARRCGASCSANPAPVPTSPPLAPAPCATATTGWSTGRRCGPPARTPRGWAILLARTDPDVPKHQGMTLLRARHDRARASRSGRCARSPARPSSTRSS